MDTKRYFINSWMIRWCWKMRETKRGGNVTGLGPDCVPGSWPELTLAALQFRQEPPFPVNKSAHLSWLVRFSLSLPSLINCLSSFGTICLQATRPVTLSFFNYTLNLVIKYNTYKDSLTAYNNTNHSVFIINIITIS